MRPAFFLALFAAVLLLLAPGSAAAQRAGQPGTLGLGAHLGEPTGLSAKYYDRPSAAYELLAAFDLTDDFLFFSGHRLWERRLPSVDAAVHFLHGPGFFLGTGGEGAVGLSYTGGLSLPLDRFEVSLQLAPRLRLLPGTDFALGGGLGLRYYFSP